MSKQYPSLAHRLIDYYRSTTPSFVPVKSASADASQQAQLYRFLASIGDTLASDPGIVGLPSTEDGHFSWDQLYKHNLQLKKDIQSTAKKLKQFSEFMISLGNLGKAVDGTLVVLTKEARITPGKATLLSKLGLDVARTSDETRLSHPRAPGIPLAWKLLSQIVGQDAKTAVFFFSRGIFAPSSAMLLQVFGEKLGDGKAVDGYIAFLQQRGFASQLDLSADGSQLKIIYEKKIKGTRKPLGGFCLTSDVLRGNQPACGIDLVESLKFMQHHAAMDPELRDFVFNASRACNHCGYCIQTNKKQPYKSVRMKVDGETVMKCPFFLATRWTQLDGDLVRVMEKAILFNEEVVAGLPEAN